MDETKVTVEFLPTGSRINIAAGSTISDAMMAAAILMPMDCGGKGTCGRCRVKTYGPVSPPNSTEQKQLDADQLQDGWRLACQTRIRGPLRVEVPSDIENADSNWRIDINDLDGRHDGPPVVVPVVCRMVPPSLADNRADLSRLLAALESEAEGPALCADHHTAGQVSRISRAAGWRLTVFRRGSEVVGVTDRPEHVPLGLAVDLGSTKLAAYLVDLQSGTTVAAKGRLNPQLAFGADVVTRLQRAARNPLDGERLAALVREAIDGLAGDLVRQVDARRRQVCEMSLVGNSVMIHLLLGLPLAQLGAPPFVAAMDQPAELKTREIGSRLAPGSYLYLPPLIGGFVGSDHVAMIMGTDLDHPGPWRIGLDIGTNTEVVVASPGRTAPLFITSAPSGPTFEGAHLSSGMRAIAGAISEVRWQGNRLVCRTIDGGRPAGICGSGIIDAIAVLLRKGIINRQGHLDRSHPGVNADGQTIAYRLVPAAETAVDRDILITQSDISQVQLAKAAIHAAMRTLLTVAGVAPSAVEEIVLAGSFGSHIDMESAKYIGLLPDLPGTVYRQAGNAAGRGAQMLLNSRDARDRANAIAARARYVELAGAHAFHSLFAQGLVFSQE